MYLLWEKNTRNRQLTFFYLPPCSLRCSCVSCSSARRLSTGPLKTFSTFLFAILTLFIAIAPHVFVIVVLKLTKGLVQKLNEFPFLRQSALAFRCRVRSFRFARRSAVFSA